MIPDDKNTPPKVTPIVINVLLVVAFSWLAVYLNSMYVLTIALPFVYVGVAQMEHYSRYYRLIDYREQMDIEKATPESVLADKIKALDPAQLNMYRDIITTQNLAQIEKTANAKKPVRSG